MPDALGLRVVKSVKKVENNEKAEGKNRGANTSLIILKQIYMPTKICPLVKGTPSNQLLCCDRVSCSLNKSPDLICPDSNTIANCQPISELTACQRTDNAAQTVCQNHPGKSYCL